MADPISITRAGHRTFFKWHRARKCVGDPAFTLSRILEGMRLGASIEVDLVIHADRGFAVLHDLRLGRESTGEGPVLSKTAAQLRTQKLRDNDGVPTNEPVLLLDDLAALLLNGRVHPDALLQLDYKEDAAALDPRALDTFANSVASVAGNMILSSGDAEAVQLLTTAAPGLRIGYDPCHGDALARLAQSRDFTGFVTDAVAASPAEMIYLAHQLVLQAEDAGFDLVAAFHARDRRVDAYTIQQADRDSLGRVERLLALKVDQITTDDPQGLAAALDR
ncbi:glycerophosphodiester phosphodiesterase [uncultured Devosia sp.]|uniref:glycerophosphodiester phosphodiesterase n=1 Tax=uncultured Devosia sp. TaxID=211434 RepID=UPI0035CA3EB9